METSKGPWMVEVKPTQTGQSLRVICQNHSVVALVKDSGGRKLANAYALAATLDLLASLEAVISLAEEAVMARINSDDPEDNDSDLIALYLQEISDAHAAIAKAKGEQE
jgi:hypothetical protein